jgi:transposase
LQRRLIPLPARLGRLLGRGQENADHKAAGRCRELRKGRPALWIVPRAEGVEATNNVSEHALRPAVLRRTGSFGSDREARSRIAERFLTVAATCRQQERSLCAVLVPAVEAALRGAARPSLFPAG